MQDRQAAGAERTLMLDAGLIGIQAPAEFLQQARILHRLPGELPRVRIRLAEFCKRSSHARDFTIGHLAGQIHTRPGKLLLRDALRQGIVLLQQEAP